MINDDIKFTIMTPTYNRGKLLKRLYKSILKQKRSDIEWIIVDDGSTDNTKDIVKSFLAEGKIKVKYIYQNNSGKYKAYNTGIENADGELFFCVDSDDILADNTLDILDKKYNNIKDRTDLAGIVSLKTDFDNNILSDNLPENEILHFYELRNKYKIHGEFCIIYFLSVLKNFRYPDVLNEKFITDSVLYDAIDKKYKMLAVNKVMNLCEYQSDGLTNRIKENMLKNPTGYKIYYMQRIDLPCSFKERIGYIIRYNTFKKISKDKKYNYNGCFKILVKLMSVIGILGKIYYLRGTSN